MIKEEHIKKICPNNKNPKQIADALNKVLPDYGITTKKQIAHFIGQTAHESGEYNILKENLNYSAEGLCKVWPKRFTPATAGAYGRNPEKIANKVYCDRMGNGNEASGDGWKYKGSGFLQLTGKDNYSKFAKYLNKPLDETVDFCNTIEGAAASACWFWVVNNLNKFCDKDDYIGLTKAINGGTHGIDDRTNKTKKALSVLDFEVLVKPEVKKDAPKVEPVKIEEPTEEPSILDDIEQAVDDAIDTITRWFHD